MSVWCGRNLRVHLSIGCARYRSIEGDIEISGGESVFPIREGAEGVCQRVVKVKISCEEVGAGKGGKDAFGAYQAVGGVIGMEQLHRGDSERAVGGAAQVFWGENIYREHFQDVVRDGGA